MRRIFISMSKQSWKTGRYSLALFPDEKKYSSHLYLLLKTFGTFGYKSIKNNLNHIPFSMSPLIQMTQIVKTYQLGKEESIDVLK